MDPAGVIYDLARRFAPMLSELRRPLAALSFGLLAPLIPVSHYVLRAYSSISPEGDQRVFADPEMEAMFVDDIVLVVKGRCQAVIDDVRLWGRDWDFGLADVTVLGGGGTATPTAGTPRRRPSGGLAPARRRAHLAARREPPRRLRQGRRGPGVLPLIPASRNDFAVSAIGRQPIRRADVDRLMAFLGVV